MGVCHLDREERRVEIASCHIGELRSNQSTYLKYLDLNFATSIHVLEREGQASMTWKSDEEPRQCLTSTIWIPSLVAVNVQSRSPEMTFCSSSSGISLL